MLEPQDIELIRTLIREENAALLKRLSDQNRQREHRERRQNARHNHVTNSPGEMSQSVTNSKNGDSACHNSPSENVTNVSGSPSSAQVPLMVSPTPPSLISPINKNNNARANERTSETQTSGTNPGDLFGNNGTGNSERNNDADHAANSGSRKTRSGECRPGSFEELRDYCASVSLLESDAVCLWEHWIGNGFTNHGSRMKNWKAVISNWERRNIFFPSKQVEKYKK